VRTSVLRPASARPPAAHRRPRRGNLSRYPLTNGNHRCHLPQPPRQPHTWHTSTRRSTGGVYRPRRDRTRPFFFLRLRFCIGHRSWLASPGTLGRSGRHRDKLVVPDPPVVVPAIAKLPNGLPAILAPVHVATPCLSSPSTEGAGGASPCLRAPTPTARGSRSQGPSAASGLYGGESWR
jgi:hypothetical protein